MSAPCPVPALVLPLPPLCISSSGNPTCVPCSGVTRATASARTLLPSPAHRPPSALQLKHPSPQEPPRSPPSGGPCPLLPAPHPNTPTRYLASALVRSPHGAKGLQGEERVCLAHSQILCAEYQVPFPSDERPPMAGGPPAPRRVHQDGRIIGGNYWRLPFLEPMPCQSVCRTLLCLAYVTCALSGTFQLSPGGHSVACALSRACGQISPQWTGHLRRAQDLTPLRTRTPNSHPQSPADLNPQEAPRPLQGASWPKLAVN